MIEEGNKVTISVDIAAPEEPGASPVRTLVGGGEEALRAIVGRFDEFAEKFSVAQAPASQRRAGPSDGNLPLMARADLAAATLDFRRLSTQREVF